MNVQKDKGLLEALCGFLRKNGCAGDVIDCEGVPVMVMEYEDKEKDLAEYFNITVEHLTDDTAQICIMHILFSDITDEQVSKVTQRIPDMNRYLSFGSFGIDRINRNVLFSSALDVTHLGDSLSVCFAVSFHESRLKSTEGVMELMPLIAD